MTTQRSRRLSNRVTRGLVWTLMIVMAIGVIYPLVWMVMSTMRTNVEIFSNPWGLPASVDFENIAAAWNQGVVHYLGTSVLVTLASTILVLGIGAATAYALTKLRLPFATAITFVILGGLMVSPTTALIPLFQLVRAIGLYDNPVVLVLLYVAYRLPFTIFLIRAYMLTLPVELEDAAKIDGAGHITTFARIIVPLCVPVLVSAGLVHALFAWNEFPFALVLINDTAYKTLPVGLLDLKNNLQTNWPVLFGGLTLAALPMIVAFIVGQRYFIRGLADGMSK